MADHTHCTATTGCEGWDEDCDNCADCAACHPLTALPPDLECPRPILTGGGTPQGPFPAPAAPYIPVGGSDGDRSVTAGVPR